MVLNNISVTTSFIVIGIPTLVVIDTDCISRCKFY